MTLCKNCMSKTTNTKTNCSICNAPMHKDCAIIENDIIYCDVCYTVKEETVIPTKLQFDIPDIIRRSYIELYKACPYKFYLEIIKGITPKENNIYAQIGIDLHELFDKACNDLSYHIKDMICDFELKWKEYKPDHLTDELHIRAINSIKRFYAILPNFPTTPYRTEETIIIDVGEDLPKISTTLDRIDLIDGELEISDWKTGKVMVGQKYSTDLQIPLYIYAAQKHYGIPVRKFTLYYLSEGKERVFVRTIGDKYVCVIRKREYETNLIDAIREVKSIFSHIKKGEFNIPKDIKKMHFTCKMCHLIESEHCRGAYIESWRMTQ